MINDWFYWGGEYYEKAVKKNISEQQYDLSDIPAIRRRRLPEVAKRIHRFSQSLAKKKIPIVYVSHHGQIAQTFSIIRSFSDDISPVKFSLSVHNAVAGLLSVVHQNTQSYQSLDSLSGLIEVAIVEALGLLNEHREVGVVYYEENLPVELSSTKEKTVNSPQVFAFTLSRGKAYSLTKSHNSRPHAIHEMDIELANVLQIVKFLYSGDATAAICYANTQWHWSREIV